MSLALYLDKGASLNPDAACLTCGDQSWSYREVATLSRRIAAALRGSGFSPGSSVGILSANDPIAFTCVFGIARAEGVWCPLNPRNSIADNRDL